MNKSLTIGSLRTDVFRVLDEYSRNGENHDIFSGGTGDMDRRFISALNGALCLVNTAIGSAVSKTRLCFSKPGILADICDFNVSERNTYVEIPFSSGAVSFDFRGCGKLVFLDADSESVGEKELVSDFGKLVGARAFVPEDAVRLQFETDSGLFVSCLKLYDKEGLHGCCDEKYLPDGKMLYCAISSQCCEILSVFDEKRRCRTRIPPDIFSFGGGVVSCDEKYAGTYTVEYSEYPECYDESDPDDTILSLSPAAYDAVVYAVAADLCEREDGELYSRLTYKYRELLANIYPKNNLTRKNSFFSGGFFGRRRRGYVFRG